MPVIDANLIIEKILEMFGPILKTSPYCKERGVCIYCGSNESYWYNSKLYKFSHGDNCQYRKAREYQLELIRINKGE